jgi:hypothetical protein
MLEFYVRGLRLCESVTFVSAECCSVTFGSKFIMIGRWHLRVGQEIAQNEYKLLCFRLDRFYGEVDPVADKLLRRADEMPRLDKPEDRSITTIYLGNLNGAISEKDLR